MSPFCGQLSCPDLFMMSLQVRYAAVRRQTAAHAGEREVQVLDYQNTAADLLPLLAQAYALLFMVRCLPPGNSPSLDPLVKPPREAMRARASLEPSVAGLPPAPHGALVCPIQGQHTLHW